MKSVFRWFCTIMVLSSMACTREPVPEKTGTIKIGLIASQNGPAMEQSRNWLEGALLAAKELKQSGEQLEIIVEDDGTNPAKMASAFQKLAAVDKVDGIIGGTWDFLAETALPLAQQYRVPFVTVTNPPEMFLGRAKKNPWIFSNSLSLEAEKTAIRSFLESLQPESVAAVYSNAPFGIQHARILSEVCHDLNIQVVYHEEFPLQANWSELAPTLASKAKAKQPELIYIQHSYEGLDIFLRELEKLQFHPTILTTQHLDQALELGQSPGRYAKAYGIYPAAQNATFLADYKAEYQREPRVYAAEGYDALKFLVKAIKEGVFRGNDPMKFEYDGVTGVHKFAPKSPALVDNKAMVMTTKNGVFEPYKP